jgi:hypothetical protein
LVIRRGLLVIEMGVYFVGASASTQQQTIRCLYCERPFKDRRMLNEHYLTAHVEAFSEEELSTAPLDMHA